MSTTSWPTCQKTKDNENFTMNYSTMIWANSKTTANNWQNLNIGTQGVQELFFCEFKTPGGSSTHWTLNSHNGIGCKTHIKFFICHWSVSILVLVVVEAFVPS